MKKVSLVLACLMPVLVAACAQSGSTTGPSGASNAAVAPVLTLVPDTAAPVGQAAAITLGSRAQKAGTIVVAVSGYNIQNRLGSNAGVNAAIGHLKWDGSLLEVDRSASDGFLGADPGAFFGDRAQVTCCRKEADGPGYYPFELGMNDTTQRTGDGEMILIRLKPVAGVTSGTTRIDLEPWTPTNFGYRTPIQLFFSPYIPSLGSVLENVYGATITIQPGR